MQIGVKLKVPPGVVVTSRMLNQAIAYRIDHGKDHPLATTRIIRWQNPGRKRGALRQWRQGNQADAWATLGRALIEAVAD